MSHWEFGGDNTGDLLNKNNMEQLVERGKQLSESGQVMK